VIKDWPFTSRVSGISCETGVPSSVRVFGRMLVVGEESATGFLTSLLNPLHAHLRQVLARLRDRLLALAAQGHADEWGSPASVRPSKFWELVAHMPGRSR
jgi:hypothetical protein